jgi:hypothetical protein
MRGHSPRSMSQSLPAVSALPVRTERATRHIRRAAGHPIALIGGPINLPGSAGSAGLNHYKMLVLAGEGQNGFPAVGTKGPTAASLLVEFVRQANGTGGAKATILQSYSFALDPGVLQRLGQQGQFDVGNALAGSQKGEKGYGTINMQLRAGKLEGLFNFSDPDGLSTGLLHSLRARVVQGSLLTAIAHGHLPKSPPTKPSGCPPAGFADLSGTRTDASEGDVYEVGALRSALSKPTIIPAIDLLNPMTTAPAVELREILITGAPTGALSVMPPSMQGNEVNTGGATLQIPSGFSFLQGDLSFDSEFSAPTGSTCLSVEGGTVAAGPNAIGGVVSPPIAQFDPGDPGSTEVHLATTAQTNGAELMQGSLITSGG